MPHRVHPTHRCPSNEGGVKNFQPRVPVMIDVQVVPLVMEIYILYIYIYSMYIYMYMYICLSNNRGPTKTSETAKGGLAVFSQQKVGMCFTSLAMTS